MWSIWSSSVLKVWFHYYYGLSFLYRNPLEVWMMFDMAMLKMLLETGALNIVWFIDPHRGRSVRALTDRVLHSYFNESLLRTLKHFYNKEKWLSHLPRSQFLFWMHNVVLFILCPEFFGSLHYPSVPYQVHSYGLEDTVINNINRSTYQPTSSLWSLSK